MDLGARFRTGVVPRGRLLLGGNEKGVRCAKRGLAAGNIIQDHNGKIEVESELGQGATFAIMLPGMDPAVLAPVAAAIDGRAEAAC